MQAASSWQKEGEITQRGGDGGGRVFEPRMMSFLDGRRYNGQIRLSDRSQNQSLIVAAEDELGEWWGGGVEMGVRD